jgi:hypothetical protein
MCDTREDGPGDLVAEWIAAAAAYTPGPRQAKAEFPNTDAFDSALSKQANVTADRGKIYGHPYDDFGRAAAIKAAVADCPDPRIRHVLEMIAVKMARLVHSPDHLDSFIDIAGYARTGVMVLDRQKGGAE